MGEFGRQTTFTFVAADATCRLPVSGRARIGQDMSGEIFLRKIVNLLRKNCPLTQLQNLHPRFKPGRRLQFPSEILWFRSGGRVEVDGPGPAQARKLRGGGRKIARANQCCRLEARSRLVAARQ